MIGLPPSGRCSLMTAVVALEWIVVALVAATVFTGGWFLNGRSQR